MSSYIKPYRIGELALPGTSLRIVNERALADWMNVDESKKAVATAERLAESNYIRFAINILSNREADIKVIKLPSLESIFYDSSRFVVVFECCFI